MAVNNNNTETVWNKADRIREDIFPDCKQQLVPLNKDDYIEIFENTSKAIYNILVDNLKNYGTSSPNKIKKNIYPLLKRRYIELLEMYEYDNKKLLTKFKTINNNPTKFTKVNENLIFTKDVINYFNKLQNFINNYDKNNIKYKNFAKDIIKYTTVIVDFMSYILQQIKINELDIVEIESDYIAIPKIDYIAIPKIDYIAVPKKAYLVIKK